jgi:5-methylcytosine-specific restriction protein A
MPKTHKCRPGESPKHNHRRGVERDVKMKRSERKRASLDGSEINIERARAARRQKPIPPSISLTQTPISTPEKQKGRNRSINLTQSEMEELEMVAKEALEGKVAEDPKNSDTANSIAVTVDAASGLPSVYIRSRLANEIWEKMLQFCKHQCLACGNEAFPMSQDHVEPIILGGANDASNIQPLCLPCNQTKGKERHDYRPADWPWRQAVVIPEILVQPDKAFEETQALIQKAMAAMRTAKSAFVSAGDPHIRWIRNASGGVDGECGYCQEKFVLSQKQVDRSVDNAISEAHVAYHLAEKFSATCKEQTRKALELYRKGIQPKP